MVESPISTIFLSGLGRVLPQSSSYSAFRDPGWNRHIVCYRLPFWKINVESQLSENVPSKKASIFWDCLNKSEELDCRISPTSWIKLRPQGGLVPIIPIRTGEDVSTIPIALPMLHGLLMLMPGLLTCCGVLWIHTLPDAVSTKIPLVAGVKCFCGVNLIVIILWSIPGFVSGGHDRNGPVNQSINKIRF